MNEAKVFLRPPDLTEAQGHANHVSKWKLFNCVLLVGQRWTELQRACFQHAERRRNDGGIRVENFFCPAALNEEIPGTVFPFQRPAASIQDETPAMVPDFIGIPIDQRAVSQVQA